MIVGERTVFLPWWRAMLKELQAEQQRRWRAGDRVFVDAYLLRYPELAANPDVLCDLILGELVLRENGGEAAPLDDYLRRYPQCARQLVQRYQASLATALPPAPTLDMPQGVAATLNMSPSHNMETIQVDEAGQIAAQEQAFQQGVPKIPGYTILSELGRGGMGVVYRARQLSVNRDVALKVVRSDVLDTLPMATRNSTLARFRHEAHAAARLDHDNLVPVYDVGEAGSLRYYAMRFVDGVSLYDMLRNKALSNQDAARYIEPVARGLHYAHEKGVLHRDLKPHNIIVERKSDRPMLTDFGLAKFLEQRDELTHAGDVMGTPSYMSPEQARDSGKVTALADVYSLGATLYHVLTSRPPFQAANVAETIRQVLDEEPVPPRRLNPAIDRDLETICLKCLQKEPARRYESALALADDLKRYLEHKPILARPAGRVERTWRWCRRNPRLASAIGTAVAFATFTVVASTAGYVGIKAAKAKSDARLQQALVVVDDLFTRISEEELLNQPGMQPLRRELLEKALKHYQYFLAESDNDPAIQDEVAAAHFRIGLIALEMGEYEFAKTELDLARAQQERLLQDAPTDTSRMEALGDTFNLLGNLSGKRGSWSEAVDYYSKSDATRSKLANLDEQNLDWQRKLASVRMNLGMAEMYGEQSEKGRRHMQNAQERRLALLERNPAFTAARRDLARGYFNLANYDSLDFLALPEPRPPEPAEPAIRNMRAAIQHAELLGGDESDSLTTRYFLATAHRQLGGLLADTGQIDAALAAYDAAKDPMTSLAIGNPKVETYQAEWAMLSMNEGELFKEQKNLPRAREEWLQARRILTKLVDQNQGNGGYARDLASTFLAEGRIEMLAGNRSKAVKALEAAISTCERFARKFPEDDFFDLRLQQAQDELTNAQTQSDSDQINGDGSSDTIKQADKSQ